MNQTNNGGANLCEKSEITENTSREAVSAQADNAQAVTECDITREIKNALKSEEVRQLIYENDEIVNEVIERYLRSLSDGGGIPVVRGLSALTPVRKPKTLSEAKAIVDGK